MTDKNEIEAVRDVIITTVSPNWYVIAEAAIKALDAHREKQGFVVVPVEPTEHMKEKAAEMLQSMGAGSALVSVSKWAYKAMIAASQEDIGQ